MASGEAHSDAGGQSRNLVQLLALFLLLLSVFILLNSLSRFEHKRTQAVLGSLGASFSGTGPLPSAGPFVAAGNRAALERFRAAVRQALLSVVSPAALSFAEGGGMIEVRLGAGELFLPASAELRPDRTRLLQALAAALRGRPADLRFDAELVLASDGAEDALTLARAGSFARALVAQGAPEDAVSVGLAPGRPETLRLRFAYRTPDDGKVSLVPAAREPRP